MRHRFPTRHAIAAIAGTLLAAAAQAAPLFHVVDLGPSGTVPGVLATGLNNQDVAVGITPGHATMFEASGWTVIDDGGPSTAAAINDVGTVIVNHYDSRSNCVPSTWNAGTVTPIPMVGKRSTCGQAINIHGDVVGFALTGSNLPIPVRYHDFATKPLALPAGSTYGIAADINDTGVVVGYLDTPSGHIHAMRWQHGQWTDLGTGGDPDADSDAWRVNASGQVVGNIMPATGTPRSVLFDTDGSVKTLDTSEYGSPTGLNAAGHACGNSQQTSAPWFFDGARTWRVQAHLDTASVGWNIEKVVGVNDHDTLAATAFPPGSSYAHVVLLTRVQ